MEPAAAAVSLPRMDAGLQWTSDARRMNAVRRRQIASPLIFYG